MEKGEAVRRTVRVIPESRSKSGVTRFLYSSTTNKTIFRLPNGCLVTGGWAREDKQVQREVYLQRLTAAKFLCGIT